MNDDADGGAAHAEEDNERRCERGGHGTPKGAVFIEGRAPCLHLIRFRTSSLAERKWPATRAGHMAARCARGCGSYASEISSRALARAPRFVLNCA